MTTGVGTASIKLAMRERPVSNLMTKNNRPREDGRLICNRHLSR